MLKNIGAGISKRSSLLRDREADPEKRVFALLELLCFPVSFLTLLAVLPATIICRRYGIVLFPGAWSDVFNVLLSASIGYMTNYIAIEMLFKPYHKNSMHPLSIITLGYWKQGLVPKNKSRIGAELGREIETRLLDPEQLANDLCMMVTDLLQSKPVTEKFKNSVQELLKTHETKIVGFLSSRIEVSVNNIISSFFTRDKISEIWDNIIAPQLRSEEYRRLTAQHIVDALKRRSPDLIAALKEELRDITLEYMRGKIPFGLGAEKIADGLVKVINWQDVGNRICSKVEDEKTLTLIREELLTLIDKFEEWSSTPEGVEKIDSVLRDLQAKMSLLIKNYLKENLPLLIAGILDSDALWEWVENDLLVNARPQIEDFIKNTGKDTIVEKLDIAGRISGAVDKQDVAEFHNMIDSIAAQHLGAIQVLGFFLGAIVGIAQIFVK